MLTPIPLATTSDQGQSLPFSTQRLVNCYLAPGRPGSKSPYAVVGTPGMRPFANVGNGPCRGLTTMDGVLYVVSDDTLFSVSGTGVSSVIGAVHGSDRVVMANNGRQLAIAVPSINRGYIYNVNTGAFGEVPDGDFFGATSVDYLNGYFIWSSPGGTFQISALEDGTDYDGLDFATAESKPDALLRAYVVGAQVFMFGAETVEIWYNSGNSDFPFERVNQAIISKGLSSPHVLATLDNTVFWLASDPEAGGGPIVVRTADHTPAVISTPAIEKALESVDLELCHAFAYKQAGHLFFCIVPADRAALVYDVVTQTWHERVTYGENRWMAAGHAYAYGKHIVGSAADGTLYELDDSYYFDGEDTPLVLDMTLPSIGTDGIRRRLAHFRLDLERGVGLTSGQGADPQVMLTFSLDGANTWSNELWRPMGAIGDRLRAAEWRRLGPFETMVLRFSVSDPVKRVFIGAWADIV